MNRKNLSILISSLVIILVGGFYLVTREGNTNGNPWKMIPDTPAFVLQTDKPGCLYNKLSRENEIFKSLEDIKPIEALNKSVKQFLNIIGSNQELKNKFLDSPLYLTVYPDSASGRIRYLLLFKIRKDLKINQIKNIISDSKKDKTINFSVLVSGKSKILNVAGSHSGRHFYVAVVHGVVLLSSSENLLRGALNTYYQKKSNFTENKAFKQVAKTSGKIVDARLYINYHQLTKLFLPIVNLRYKRNFRELSNFARWTEVDLLLKSKNLLLFGYTYSGSQNLLSRFNKKRNGENVDMYSLVPFNSNLFLKKTYQAFSKETAEKQLRSFSKVFRKSLKSLIRISNQVCYVSNALSINEIPDKSYGIVSFDDELKAKTLLKNLSIGSSRSRIVKYENHIIRRINIKGFLPSLYGKIFSGVPREYYTFLNGSAVFGHSPDDLSQLIRDYDTGKTLDLNDNFKVFSTNTLQTADLTFQLQLRSFLKMFPKYLDKKTADKLLNYKNILNNFQYLTLQFNKENPMFYTNFALQYNSSYKEENLAVWKIQLNDSIVGKPFLVKDYRNGKYDIIVFDNANRMYFIDNNGKILWTKRLPNLPMSKIYQVDYYKNGKIQYLFNTAHNLFLIDRKGHFVADYPIPLRPAATNGISVFDYNNRKDYRILVAQADEKIHDYTIKGNPVRGWNLPQMPDITVQPVYRLLADHHDYIIITDIHHHVRIVNRRGRQRIYLKSSFQKAKNSAYYVNKTNNKGIILTTDEKGQLVYISRSGRISTTSFGKFSPNHYFLYEDFNGDLAKDFIYIDHKKLTVFNRFKKVLFTYTFSSNIDVQPEFFSLGGRQKVLGVVASRESTIYLFDNQGNILIGRGLTGATPFTVGSLNQSGNINLITAAGNTLYNYRIK